MESVKYRVEKQIGDSVLSFETGQLAKQASACILTQYGDTVVLTRLRLDHRVLAPTFSRSLAIIVSDLRLLESFGWLSETRRSTYD